MSDNDLERARRVAVALEQELAQLRGLATDVITHHISNCPYPDRCGCPIARLARHLEEAP
jgi:hypothetical protein